VRQHQAGAGADLHHEPVEVGDQLGAELPLADLVKVALDQVGL
jgi:hypothetical protein